MKERMISVCLFGLLVGFHISDASVLSRDVGLHVQDSADENSPNLLHMLNALKGGSNMETMMNFLKEFKGVREAMQEWMSISPLMVKMIKSASKKNIKIKVLLDVINGHLPDLKDIYEFATKPTNSIVKDIINAQRNDSDMHTFYYLMLNKTDPEKQLRLYTGKKIVLKPTLVNQVKSGTYKVTPQNVNQVNALEMWTFVEDNWITISHSLRNISSGNIDYVRIMQFLQSMDLTHLSRVVSPRSTMDNTKYTVTGESQIMQDPDVKMIIQDLKTGRSLSDDTEHQSKAESLLLDMCVRGARVFNKVMTKASAGGSSNAANNDKDANSMTMG